MLIVSTTGPAGDVAHRLREAIAALDLRVKLDVLPALGLPSLPEVCEADARRARLCIILSNRSKAVLYAHLPAPRFQGQRAVFAAGGTRAGPQEAEMGVLTEEVGSLAARVAERLR